MWADFSKLTENNELIKYRYGFESHILTGQISYEKRTGKSSIDMPSENNSLPKLVLRLFNHIIAADFPPKQTVVIG